MEIEGESRRITLEESSDSSSHSLLIIDTSSFVVFLRKAFSEGSKGSSWNDDFARLLGSPHDMVIRGISIFIKKFILEFKHEI